MAWRRDPATGEWEMVDPMTPDPNTQGTTGQEPDPSARNAPVRPLSPPPAEAGYASSEHGGAYPVMTPDMMPERTAEGAPIYAPSRVIQPEQDQSSAGYQNEDYAEVERWVREVEARGNQVVHTAAGVFETADGVTILSEMPKPSYRMN